MECHGTGTPLGDPIEIGGLKSINASRRGICLSSKRQKEFPFVAFDVKIISEIIF